MSVLVTGAGSGIGKAAAHLLAERDFKVAVTDLDEEAAQRVAAELDSFSTVLNVTSRQSIREAMDEAEAAIGPLDGLVANAGVSSFVSFLDMPDADWHLMLDVNTTGVFYCGQEFARRLVAMQRRELVWEGKLRGMTPEEVFELYVKDTPLGRIETAEDVARAIVFLLGPDSSFITGEALAVNGGAFMD
jgi:NAD(P)-dependent dehydrogenase (short-subunit alcohol dehydrogenase family)